jgi:translation initiation factor 1
MSKTTRGDGWELIPAKKEPEKKEQSPYHPSVQTIRVREEKRAQGKVVTVASGYRLGKKAALDALAKQLKALCGAGGTTTEDTIEVQGRHVDKIAARLEKDGFKVRTG